MVFTAANNIGLVDFDIFQIRQYPRKIVLDRRFNNSLLHLDAKRKVLRLGTNFDFFLGKSCNSVFLIDIHRFVLFPDNLSRSRDYCVVLKINENIDHSIVTSFLTSLGQKPSSSTRSTEGTTVVDQILDHYQEPGLNSSRSELNRQQSRAQENSKADSSDWLKLGLDWLVGQSDNLKAVKELSSCTNMAASSVSNGLHNGAQYIGQSIGPSLKIDSTSNDRTMNIRNVLSSGSGYIENDLASSDQLRDCMISMGKVVSQKAVENAEETYGPSVASAAQDALETIGNFFCAYQHTQKIDKWRFLKETIMNAMDSANESMEGSGSQNESKSIERDTTAK